MGYVFNLITAHLIDQRAWKHFAVADRNHWAASRRYRPLVSTLE